MELLGKWNWWAPGPLRRLHERFGIGECALPAGAGEARARVEPTSGDARFAVQFDADTAVEDLGGGRFAAAMSERWWVGKGPNGGYVAAVILRAIQAAAAPSGRRARSPSTTSGAPPPARWRSRSGSSARAAASPSSRRG